MKRKSIKNGILIGRASKHNQYQSKYLDDDDSLDRDNMFGKAAATDRGEGNQEHLTIEGLINSSHISNKMKQNNLSPIYADH